MTSERNENVLRPAEQEQAREPWIRPAFERIEAGSAEGGSTTVTDIGTSFS